MAQTFFADTDMRQQYKLDAVVAVVDATHTSTHLDKVKPDSVKNKVGEQVLFANQLILNKTDLVNNAKRKQVILELHTINVGANIVETTRSQVNLDHVLGVQAFSLACLLQHKDEFLTQDLSNHQNNKHVTSMGIKVDGALNTGQLKVWLLQLL